MSWNLDGAYSTIQSWRPGAKRSKIFTGVSVLITREVEVKSPEIESKSQDNRVVDISLDKSVANITYRVQWGDNNVHWLSIYLSPEAHSWCNQVV